MATPESKSQLPNLKIEIENDLEEAMEIDDPEPILGKEESKEPDEDEEAEEGEISDSKDSDDGPTYNHPSDRVSSAKATSPKWELAKRYENRFGGFVTGVDIFGDEEQEKLDERAKRFGLTTTETKPSKEQLKKLHESLGMKEDDISEKYRLSALHMRGTENMSTADVYAYFKEYCPSSLEWINDYSCNVVWLDTVSAIRALMGLSREIKGLEDFHAKANPYLKDSEKEEVKETDKKADEVVVIVEELEEDNADVVMVVDGHTDETTDAASDIEKLESKLTGATDGFKLCETDAVDAADIKVPIPPGRWRVGVPCLKAKCILLRFATRDDKKPPKAEKLSEYYKKHGNPNYGGIRGLITTSRKRRYHRQDVIPVRVFHDDQGDYRDVTDDLKDNSKNPWGTLAKSWSNIDRLRKKPDPYDEESPPRKMTPPPSPQMGVFQSQGRSVLDRLGYVSQMRSASDDESKSSNSDSDGQWSRKTKVPRMRMYADDEEKLVEKRKAHVDTRRRQPHSRDFQDFRVESRTVGRTGMTDLRNRINREGRSRAVERVQRVHNRVSRQAGHRTSYSDSESSYRDEDDDDDDELPVTISLRGSITKNQGDSSISKKQGDSSRLDGEDLRSKLNRNKGSRPDHVRQKSPLRIEIDNDEYYRVIGSDQE